MTNKTYLENKIKEYISVSNNCLNKIHGLNVYLEHCEIEEEPHISKDIDKLYSKFNLYLKQTYFLILNYIESQNNITLLQYFKNDLQKVIAINYEGVQTVYIDEIEDTYYVSEDLNKMSEYLNSYPAFEKDIYKRDGIIFLENILGNTSVILKDLNKIPKSEIDVCSNVKFVTKATFPDSSFPTEIFHKTAKCYKPDILIPSLNVAIEYKYVKDERKLSQTLEQILIDVEGYSNHDIFKIFYAVFYVKVGICDQKRFQVIWDDYRFPPNWKPVFVIGE